MYKVAAVVFFLLGTFSSYGEEYWSEKKESFTFISYEFLVQKDTIYDKYLQLKKKLGEKEYSNVLREGLILLNMIEERKDVRNIVLLTYLLGETFEKADNYENAISFYKKSYNQLLSEKVEDLNKAYEDREALIAERLLKIGGLYHKMEKIDSAKIFYDSAIRLDSQSKSVNTVVAKALNNLSYIYLDENNYKKAKESCLKSIEIHTKYGNFNSLASAHINLGNIYIYKKSYIEAEKAYRKGLEFVKDDKSDRATKFKEDLYFNLAYAKSLSKDHRAYKYLLKSYYMRDSVLRESNKEKLADVLAKHNVEAAKKEVRQEEELKRQKVEQNTWIIGLCSLIIIIFLAFMLNQNKLRRKNLNLELSKKETESQIEVLNANLKGQETERRRISQELHDGVLSKLFGSRIGLGYLELDSDAKTQGQYQKYLEELQTIEEEIREVSHQLSSDISLSETSLLNAINQLLKEKSRLGDFDFQLKMDDAFSWKKLDGVLEINLFRILQESLQNVIKHAEAKNVNVSFGVKKNVLVVAIEDDGVGFDIKKKSKGIGLKNIRSRIEKLKGTMRVSSETGKGTVLELKIPLV